jgi:hypothetical protein
MWTEQGRDSAEIAAECAERGIARTQKAIQRLKARRWCEEWERQDADGNFDRAGAIRLSLIDLLYRLENDLT